MSWKTSVMSRWFKQSTWGQPPRNNWERVAATTIISSLCINDNLQIGFNLLGHLHWMLTRSESGCHSSNIQVHWAATSPRPSLAVITLALALHSFCLIFQASHAGFKSLESLMVVCYTCMGCSGCPTYFTEYKTAASHYASSKAVAVVPGY